MAKGLQDLLRVELANLIVDAEGDIVDKMLMDYKTGKLTSERAWASVGEIAGLRRLIENLDTQRRLENKKSIYEHGDEPKEDE